MAAHLKLKAPSVPQPAPLQAKAQVSGGSAGGADPVHWLAGQVG